MKLLDFWKIIYTDYVKLLNRTPMETFYYLLEWFGKPQRAQRKIRTLCVLCALCGESFSPRFIYPEYIKKSPAARPALQERVKRGEWKCAVVRTGKEYYCEENGAPAEFDEQLYDVYSAMPVL